MYEVRFHGVGGQGVVAAADLLGVAAVKDGKWAHSFPFFGTEVRGGSVKAFVRIAEAPIRVRSFIYEPDMVVVFAPHLLSEEILEGVKRETLILVNASQLPIGLPNRSPGKIKVIDAESIATDIPGCHMINCVMLGAVASLSSRVGLKSVEMAIRDRLPEDVAKINVEAARVGYRVAQIRDG